MPNSTCSPTVLEKADIEARVQAFPFWYHRIELPHGVVTPGWAPLDAAAYRVPEDLAGKRVLDVGAWDGYWTFEALKRGAREVVAVDDFSDFVGKLKSSDRKSWATFDLCRDLLGFDEDRCQRHEMNVYEIDEKTLGRFDVVFLFGVIYHLRHPLLALDRISAICDEEIFIESAILNDFSPYRGGVGHGYPGGQFVMEFYPNKQYGNNETNWWVPTLECLGHMVRSAGFTNVTGWKLLEEPESLGHCRGFIHGTKA